jgi:outer membrane murein-binding lipoprotein Lpp
VISLRYHIVTIVAVFLALAVGLLAGSAFVEPELVDQLRARTDDLRDQVAQREEDLTQARAQADALDGFVDAALPSLTQNRLIGQDVIVVAQEGVEDAVIGETQRSLVDAGANLVAVVSAREEMVSEDPDTRARLAALVSAEAAPEQATDLAVAALADRLANGASGVPPEDDLLAQLLSGGFLAPVGAGLSEAALQQVGSDGQVVIVLAGGQDEEPAMAPDQFAVPLVRALSELGVPVAAGESSTSLVPFVAGVRDGDTDGLVTVDDLDLSIGGAALILGLDELIDTGQGGAYGIKDGAEPLPPVT